MGNQMPFQALSSSSSGAADVQGFSKAPPSNLHVRTANLLTFCLVHTHSHTQTTPLAQNQQKDLCTKLTLTMENLFPYFLSLMSPSADFLSSALLVSLWLTRIMVNSAAWKNTTCSPRQRKFICASRPLKGFRTCIEHRKSENCFDNSMF